MYKHFDENKYIFEKVIGCGIAQSVQPSLVGCGLTQWESTTVWCVVAL
jgi:hypothetical protein